MDDKAFQAWLDTAVKGIRFGPDRRAVRAELAGHLEDKSADLRRIFPDLTDEEARERTLAGMGDAAAIGKQLARVHRPWLGYLWRASQIVLAAALVWAALLLADYSGYRLWPEQAAQSQWAAEQRAEFSAHRPLVCLTEQTVGQYTLRVRSGELWSDPDQKTRAAYLRLEVQAARPWAELSWDMLDRLYAVDDRGNVIPAQNEGSAPAMDWVRAGTDGPFRSQIDLVIPLPDPAAEGLVLIYDWLGAGLSLPVSWKEGTP